MSELSDWLAKTLGRAPGDLALYERALTHSSFGEANYERLEFLGDRVLGLIVARWLFETYPDEPEGKLSHRLNALVTGEVCAEIARALDVQPRLRLGKQALDDGVFRSDNVLGDVIEALIGALYLDAGFDAANAFVRSAWGDRVDRLAQPPKHPKAALQEWTAAQRRRAGVRSRPSPTRRPRHRPRPRQANDATRRGSPRRTRNGARRSAWRSA